MEFGETCFHGDSTLLADVPDDTVLEYDQSDRELLSKLPICKSGRSERQS